MNVNRSVYNFFLYLCKIYLAWYVLGKIGRGSTLLTIHPSLLVPIRTFGSTSTSTYTLHFAARCKGTNNLATGKKIRHIFGGSKDNCRATPLHLLFVSQKGSLCPLLGLSLTTDHALQETDTAGFLPTHFTVLAKVCGHSRRFPLPFGASSALGVWFRPLSGRCGSVRTDR